MNLSGFIDKLCVEQQEECMERNGNTVEREGFELKSKIKRLLFESSVKKEQHQTHKEKPENGHGKLMVLTSKKDETILKHQQDSDESLFETYEDYVAYMIDDDKERPQYSTFVSMDDYDTIGGIKTLNEGVGRVYDYYGYDEYDGFKSINEYWKDSMNHILREEKRKEEQYQENARKRQREWEDRQQEFEQRKKDQDQQHTTGNPFRDSVRDRISRNKQRLLSEFGLPTTASLDDVKKAYRDQMKQWHPDKYASKGQQSQDEATKKTQTLNESYQKILRQDFV